MKLNFEQIENKITIGEKIVISGDFCGYLAILVDKDGSEISEGFGESIEDALSDLNQYLFEMDDGTTTVKHAVVQCTTLEEHYEETCKEFLSLEAENEAMKKAVVIASEISELRNFSGYSLYDLAGKALKQAYIFHPERQMEILKYFPVLIRVMEGKE